MSKPVKNLITRAYREKFEGVSGAVLVDIRGIGANDNNALRHDLNQKRIKVTVVKNSLARQALGGTDLEPLGPMLEGANAMVYPVDGDATAVSVARELMDWAKTIENLEFRGAVLDGITFEADQIKALSQYPTRDEAQAQVVQLVLSPAQNLAGAVTGPGKRVASLVKAIEEKLEQGETIRKAG